MIFALAILAGIIVLVFAVRAKMAQAADTNQGKKLHEARLAEWKAKGWGIESSERPSYGMAVADEPLRSEEVPWGSSTRKKAAAPSLRRGSPPLTSKG